MTRMNVRELDVLNILWKHDEPMTAIDIVNERNELTQSTVTAVLRKLLKAGLVQVEGVTHSGKVLSRTYRPTESSKDAILEHFTEDYRSFTNVISESNICAAILKSNDDKAKTRSEIKQLKTMLKDYERDL
ncbi:MAG: MarR family transcriptional regulator [Lachnospiraceae bacterium]|nr:MarR family transcriptional regulator [Lachnospiraceae bacterium]